MALTEHAHLVAKWLPDSKSSPTEYGKPSSRANILFLVFHGGSPLDSRRDSVSKDIDFQTLSNNFSTILGLHFPSAVNRVALRMVPCVDLCTQVLDNLTQVHY